VSNAYLEYVIGGKEGTTHEQIKDSFCGELIID